MSVMRVSVVIPAFDEEGNIARLVEETFGAIPEKLLGEVIVVDDGSGDGTRAELAPLLARHAAFRYIRHERTSGQSAALRTGILAAAFPVIATMDGDGQNDPADIPKLLELLGPPGSEPAMASGVREARKATGSRRFASRFANWIRDRVLRDDCPDTGCGIKVYRREAFLALPFFTSMHRYLPALMQSYGHSIAYAPVNDRPRLAGRSKYTNLGRAVIGLYDLFGVTWLRRRTVAPRVAEDSARRSTAADGRMAERSRQ